MLDVFTPPRPPQLGSGESVTPRVLRANFGEGYSSRGGEGLNTILPNLPLVWNGLYTSERRQITQFFKERNGTEAFLWTPPGESEQIKVIAKSWSHSGVTPAIDRLTAEFEVVADL